MAQKHLEVLANRQIEETLNGLWLAASAACDCSHNHDQTKLQRIPPELVNFLRLVSFVQSKYGLVVGCGNARGLRLR